MGLDEEILETEFGENGVKTFVETAFRKPKPAGPTSERFFECTHRDAELQAHGLGIGLVRGQERVRAHASEERELADFFKALEGRDNFACTHAFPKIYQGVLATGIEFHDRHDLIVSAVAFFLLLQEFRLLVKVAGKFLEQESVCKHRQKRRGHAQVERSGNTAFMQAPQHLHNRQIRFRHSLEEPVLFQEPVV